MNKIFSSDLRSQAVHKWNLCTSKKGVVFLALFTILALIAINVKIFAIQGITGNSFTLFEFFGPMAGGFLGIAGAGIAGIVKVASVLTGGASLTLLDGLRLTSMLFAALYFSRNGLKGMKDKLGVAIPVLAMLAFWAHPIGQQAWFYALYWLVPIAAKFLPENIILRSLGATFTAHCMGSIWFLYTFETTATLWTGLIPVVAVERGLFALGIAASYVVFTNILSWADKSFEIGKYVTLEKKYILQ